MISFFETQHPAQGEKFISRDSAARQLAGNIKARRFTTLYSAPGYGKKSLVNKALQLLKEESYPIVPITIDLFNITTEEAFAARYTGALKKHIDDYNKSAMLPLNIDFSSMSTALAVNLPHIAAGVTGTNFVIYFKEFQNILNIGGGEKLLKMMEKELAKHDDVAYIVTGEQVNRMKEIFEVQKYFVHTNEHLPLEPLDLASCLGYMRNGFLRTGKALEEETGEAIYNTAKGNPQIINRLCAICDPLALGYINKKILRSAVDTYFQEQEPLWRYTVSNLTGNQINFLRAVCDGAQKFSSGDTLKKYHLNSSANVFRLKEALSKKEIVTFSSDERAEIIDPMFELWLKKRYFA